MKRLALIWAIITAMVCAPMIETQAALRAASTTGGAAAFSTLTLSGPQLGIFDSSTSVGTTAFVQAAIQGTMATKPLNLGATGGGLYSFASLGTGALIVYGTSGGAITSIISVGAPGSGYKVGDLIGIVAGNNDATLRVLTISGSGIATVGILYGGTGYAGFAGSPASRAASSFFYTLTLTGTLTSNATFIMTNGTLLTQSNQWLINNNTTGAFTTTVNVSDGTDTATGTGVVIPQGTNNNRAVFIQSDGSTDVWFAAPTFSAPTGFTVGNTLPSLATANGIDIQSAGIGLVLGADTGSLNSRTDATNKGALIAAATYLNAGPPYTLIYAQSISGANNINIGGGSAGVISPTIGVAQKINFLTFATQGAAIGTVIANITPTGLRVGTGTAAASALDVTGTAGFSSSVTMPGLATSSAITTGTVCWTTGTGNLNVDTTTTCLLSSGKYKKAEKPLDSGLQQVLALKPVSYVLKDKYNPTHLGEQIGFFAEDVAKVDKRLVSTEKDGSPHAVRYQQLTAVLTKAIQEQQKQIELLSRQVRELQVHTRPLASVDQSASPLKSRTMRASCGFIH